MSGSVTTRRVWPLMSIVWIYSGPARSCTSVPVTADQSSDRPRNDPGIESTPDPSRFVKMIGPLAYPSPTYWPARRPFGTTLARRVSVNPSALIATDLRPISSPVVVLGARTESAPLRLWYG